MPTALCSLFEAICDGLLSLFVSPKWQASRGGQGASKKGVPTGDIPGFVVGDQHLRDGISARSVLFCAELVRCVPAEAAGRASGPTGFGQAALFHKTRATVTQKACDSTCDSTCDWFRFQTQFLCFAFGDGGEMKLCCKLDSPQSMRHT